MRDQAMDAIYYLFLLLLVAAGLVESAFLPHLRIAGHQPDLLLTLVVAWSLVRGLREGLIWALIAGLVLDMLSGAPFGVFTACLIAASLVSSLGSANFFRSSALLPVAASLLATVVYYGTAFLLLFLGGRRIAWVDVPALIVGPALLANVLCMIVLYRGVRWLHRSTSPREVVW